jgi:uncharacterized membrane protein YphA (DoxX/SURF4 family)
MNPISLQPSWRAPYRRIVDFFAVRGHPVDLAILRIVVFGALFVVGYGHPNDVRWFASLPEALFVPPPGWAGLFPFLPLDPTFAAGARWLFLAACFSAMIGFATRPAALLALLTSLYVLGLPQSVGKLNHFHHLWWMAAVLAVSPAGDAWSIDRWRSARPVPAPSVAHGLPIRFTWVFVGIAYFFPGLWKVGICGLDWALGDNLRWIMYQKWIELDGFLPLVRVDTYPWLYRLGALTTLVFEIGFLPALFFPRIRPFFVITAFLFHQGTWLTMNIGFHELVVCYVAFVPWSRLLAETPIPLESAAPESTAPESTASESTPPPTPSNRLTIMVGSALVAVTMLFGALGIDSWPIAVYPRFHYFAPQAVNLLKIEAIDEAGNTHPLDERNLKERFDSSRWSHLQRRLLADPRNGDLWRPFHGLVVAELAKQLEERPRRIVYAVERRTTDPATWDDPPLFRRALAVVEVPAEE